MSLGARPRSADPYNSCSKLIVCKSTYGGYLSKSTSRSFFGVRAADDFEGVVGLSESFF